MAGEFLELLRTEENGLLYLPWIVGDMPRELSGIEIGFLTVVGEAASAGAAIGIRLVEYWEKCGQDGLAKKTA